MPGVLVPKNSRNRISIYRIQEKPAIVVEAAINIMCTHARGLLKLGQGLPANSVPGQIISRAKDGKRCEEDYKNRSAIIPYCCSDVFLWRLAAGIDV